MKRNIIFILISAMLLALHAADYGESADYTKRMALREYNDSRKWQVIADANGIDDPKNVRAGTIVELPPLYGDNMEKIKEIIYSSVEIKDRFDEHYELKLLKENNFINHSYLIILGIWFHVRYNAYRMVYIVTKNNKVEIQYNMAVPLNASIMDKNFYNSSLFKQIIKFQLLDNIIISFQYDFNHDGSDELLYFYQNNITGNIHCCIYLISINVKLVKAFDISEFPCFSIYPEFINYKCRQGIKFFDGEEYVFYYYDRLQQKYMQDEEATSEELEQIHGSPDFFAEAGIDYTKLARPLVPTDLEGFSKPALRIWRNAVYARHGRTFKSEDLQALFNEYAWYKADEEYGDDRLSDTDRANIRLIQEFERK